MKIFFIGFMASGKSTVGSKVADLLGVPFYDLDVMIEKGEGKSVPVIFSESGEATFRLLESEYLKKLVAVETAVVATGGGTPCFFDHLDWMKNNGVVIYLRTDIFVLFDRLQSFYQNRPLISGKKDKILLDFIKSTLQKRSVFYESAHLIFDIKFENQDPAPEIGAYLKRILPP